MEIDYNQLDTRFRFYLDAIEIIKQDKIHSSGLINDYYLTDRLQIINEIDSFVKTNPENKEKYLTPLLKRYNLIQELIIENFGDSIYNFHSENMGIQPKYDGSEKMNLLGKIIHDTDFIIEHLNELLNPEKANEQPEPTKTPIKAKGQTKLSREQNALLFWYLREESLIAPNIQNDILSTALGLMTEYKTEQYNRILRMPGTPYNLLGKDKKVTKKDLNEIISELNNLIKRIEKDLLSKPK